MDIAIKPELGEYFVCDQRRHQPSPWRIVSGGETSSIFFKADYIMLPSYSGANVLGQNVLGAFCLGAFCLLGQNVSQPLKASENTAKSAEIHDKTSDGHQIK